MVTTIGYIWLHRKDRPPKSNDIYLKELICQIVLEFVGYGYRRVTSELRRRGYTVNRKKVLRLMREENLALEAGGKLGQP